MLPESSGSKPLPRPGPRPSSWPSGVPPRPEWRYVQVPHSVALTTGPPIRSLTQRLSGLPPLRIGELDLMAASGKLSRQRGADISSTDDSDLPHNISSERDRSLLSRPSWLPFRAHRLFHRLPHGYFHASARSVIDIKHLIRDCLRMAYVYRRLRWRVAANAGPAPRARSKARSSDYASASLQFVRRQLLRGQLPLGRQERGPLLVNLEIPRVHGLCPTAE